MIRFLRRGGGVKNYMLFRCSSFSRPIVHFSFASVGVLRETV